MASPERRESLLDPVYPFLYVPGRVCVGALFEPRVHLAQAFDPPLHLRREAHQVRVELAFDSDGLVGEDLHPQTQ